MKEHRLSVQLMQLDLQLTWSAAPERVTLVTCLNLPRLPTHLRGIPSCHLSQEKLLACRPVELPMYRNQLLELRLHLDRVGVYDIDISRPSLKDYYKPADMYRLFEDLLPFICEI